jgi:hypothetical protein
VDPERPTLQALVGFLEDGIGLVNQPRVFPLELAERFARLGFTVIMDTWSQEDLADWERKQRSLLQESARRRKWFERQSEDG